jgi:hypothetical protein
MTLTVIGLDLAKNVFQVHGIDESGRAVLRRKIRRSVTSLVHKSESIEALMASARAPPKLVGR